MLELSLEHKKIWVLGLIFNCPAGSEKDECKINKIREFSANEREEKVFDMTEDEVDELIKDHQSCMKKRGF